MRKSFAVADAGVAAVLALAGRTAEKAAFSTAPPSGPICFGSGGPAAPFRSARSRRSRSPSLLPRVCCSSVESSAHRKWQPIAWPLCTCPFLPLISLVPDHYSDFSRNKREAPPGRS
jgi:hypothetical protein